MEINVLQIICDIVNKRVNITIILLHNSLSAINFLLSVFLLHTIVKNDKVRVNMYN